MKKIKVALLGSSSHIAKGLINNFIKSEDFSLYLYTRSPDNVRNFLNVIGERSKKNYAIYTNYRDFIKCYYDIIINCIGIGTMNKPVNNYSNYFTVTEKYDNLIIDYLLRKPNTLYISFSSGAVYGKKFSVPAEKNALNCIRVNHISPDEYYTIARINAEAKHRSFNDLRIIDLRIFSYFSRFIDLTDSYFIAEVINCILHKKVLLTNKANFIRDYVHPEDLCSIVKSCINTKNLNTAFDVTSKKPVEKREILDYFSSEYNLKYKTSTFSSYSTPTGEKNIYYSNYKNTKCINYKPEFTSMDTIKQESKHILNIR